MPGWASGACLPLDDDLMRRIRPITKRLNAGNGLTTRGTVGAAPIWWALVSAVGALMPFMPANRPHKQRGQARSHPTTRTLTL